MGFQGILEQVSDRFRILVLLNFYFIWFSLLSRGLWCRGIRKVQ